MNKFVTAGLFGGIILILAWSILPFFPKAHVAPPLTLSTMPPSETAAHGSTPPTQVIAYVPSPASSTPAESGSCWTSSIAAPFRTDAWRCTVGNSISDPCFEIPGSKDLLCGANPARPDATSSFVLKLTSSLPAVSSLAGTPPDDWAWLIRLGDGTICSPFTGTLPVTATGEAASYGCAPKKPGAESLLIFGEFNTSTPAWTAEVGFLGQSTSGLPAIIESSTVPVATVWQ